MISNATTVRVRYADTDQMGFAYYSNYLVWFEIGRTELLRQIGYPYTQLEEDGTILPVVEVYCRYHRPARYDQLVHIVSQLREIPRARIRIDYQILDEAQHTLLAEGYTVHCFVGAAGNPVRAPQAFLDVIKPYFD